MTLVPPGTDAGDDVPVDVPPFVEPVADVPVDVPPTVVPVDPAAVPDSSTVANLIITDPWQLAEFTSGVAGWDPIVQGVNSGPAATADQVIAAGAACGVTIESR